MKRILLLSAYDAQSHQYWHKGLVEAFPEYDWTVLTLPARYFAWRVRGNSLSWAIEQQTLLNQPYDAVICTSMTDLSALRGMVPKLARTPTLVYFHENQFAYPPSQHQAQSVEPQVLNLYTAFCADKVLFNSNYNRETFIDGARKLLQKLPDHAPLSVIEHIKDKSGVLPVPLKPVTTSQIDTEQPWPKNTKEITKIVWAARWEYDKGPKTLLEILRTLKAAQQDFALCLLGQHFRHSPPEFNDIQYEFAAEIVHAGFEESTARYQAWLNGADFILSTAEHEFQGIAVLEATQRGCIPIVPDTLVYPELFDQQLRYNSAQEAASLIQKHWKQKTQAPPTMHMEWPQLRECYRDAIESLYAARSTSD